MLNKLYIFLFYLSLVSCGGVEDTRSNYGPEFGGGDANPNVGDRINPVFNNGVPQIEGFWMLPESDQSVTYFYNIESDNEVYWISKLAFCGPTGNVEKVRVPLEVDLVERSLVVTESRSTTSLDCDVELLRGEFDYELSDQVLTLSNSDFNDKYLVRKTTMKFLP